jgi:hypothetical protein
MRGTSCLADDLLAYRKDSSSMELIECSKTGRDSLVSTATRFEMNGPRFESRWKNTFSVSYQPRYPPQPTHLPLKEVTVFLLGEEGKVAGVWHWTPISIKRILLNITNKMQRYTIFFILVNDLHVPGGFSAHQELKNYTHSIWYSYLSACLLLPLVVAASKLDIYPMLYVHFLSSWWWDLALQYDTWRLWRWMRDMVGERIQ